MAANKVLMKIGLKVLKYSSKASHCTALHGLNEALSILKVLISRAAIYFGPVLIWRRKNALFECLLEA